MVGLSLYVLLALATETFFRLSVGTRDILRYADTGICVIFLGDFAVNLIRARSKLEYLRWGWIDLISSIPAVDALRWGRGVRLLRLLRLLRAVRSMRRLVPFILDRRAEATFLAAAMISILMVIFSSIAILQFEGDVPGANIRTAQDAIWWSYTTITTVGYGDRYPVTHEGRLVAAALMTAGVGLFGTWTGFVASWFLAPRRNETVDGAADKQ
jgi:voltage-gated potassium channel